MDMEIDNTDEETGYVCKTCGRFNPFRFKYCPECGTKRFSGSNITPPPRIEPNYQEDRITRYLRKRNLLHLANQPMQITIHLEDGDRAICTLLGKHNSNDALQYLRTYGVIPFDEDYCFRNWPKAAPYMGSDYPYSSACVCELDPKAIYEIKKMEPTDWKVY